MGVCLSSRSGPSDDLQEQPSNDHELGPVSGTEAHMSTYEQPSLARTTEQPSLTTMMERPLESFPISSRSNTQDSGYASLKPTLDGWELPPEPQTPRPRRAKRTNSAPSDVSNHSLQFFPHANNVVDDADAFSTSFSKRSITMSTPDRPGNSALSNVSRLSISIDFGAAYSGVTYTTSHPPEFHHIRFWPGSTKALRRVPTCLLYDDLGDVRAWGILAKTKGLRRGWTRTEWFKLTLDPELPYSGVHTVLPLGKTTMDAIVDFLSCLYIHAKSHIMQKNALCDINFAHVYLTAPSSWDARVCLILREAAIKAGLVTQVSPRDYHWQDRLHIIAETEASAVHGVLLAGLNFQPDQRLMVCNAGSAAVDLGVYDILRSWGNREIREACLRSGSYCGSHFLDLRFQEFVCSCLSKYPSHLDEASLVHFTLTFEKVKMDYSGLEDDACFHFGCLRPQYSDDPTVGLESGDLVISGRALRDNVFDPVIAQILDSIEHQIRISGQQVDALLLVGGFSVNEYLFRCVKDTFASRISTIVRPRDGDLSSCHGGAQCGLDLSLGCSPVVTSTTPLQNFVMRVRLPAEPIDKIWRPAYITYTDEKAMCENRVQYVIGKGTVIPKGMKVEVKLRKFSIASFDSIFETVLYASDSDEAMRYTDEGEMKKLCRCSVDLQVLPVYQEQAKARPFGGFYTDFELGFNMDGLDIRSVLLYQGREYGPIKCDALERSGHGNPFA